MTEENQEHSAATDLSGAFALKAAGTKLPADNSAESTARFLNELALAQPGEEHEDAQDSLTEFIRKRAEDPGIVAPVMALVETLDKVRRYYALNALASISSNAPDTSEIQIAALSKWEELIERIAEKDIFDALEWASHPGLFHDPESILAATGISKWSELIDRAAAVDPARALQHARAMAQGEPWSPFAILAGMSVDLIESQMPWKTETPPPALRPFN